jgi:hypothetical protein
MPRPAPPGSFFNGRQLSPDDLAALESLFAAMEQQAQQQSGGGDSHYFDRESGCSVMAGDDVSC